MAGEVQIVLGTTAHFFVPRRGKKANRAAEFDISLATQAINRLKSILPERLARFQADKYFGKRSREIRRFHRFRRWGEGGFTAEFRIKGTGVNTASVVKTPAPLCLAFSNAAGTCLFVHVSVGGTIRAKASCRMGCKECLREDTAGQASQVAPDVKPR
jgi:hypothetical protein